MKPYSRPITRDNEDEAFAYVQAKTRINSRSLAVRRVILPVGCVLFVCLSVLMTLGTFYAFADEEDMVVFGALPFIAAFWELVGEWMAVLPSEWYVQIPARVLMVFLVPVAVSAVLSLMIAIVYRGKRVAPPEGTTRERAKQLYELACEVPQSFESYDVGHSLAAFRCSIAYVGILTAFLLYGLFSIPDGFGSGLIGMLIGMAVCVVIAFFLYQFLCRFFILINSIFYAGGTVSFNLRYDTETYWVSVDEEEAARREAEEEQKQQRRRQEDEDYISACAKWYAKEQKEHEEYLNRLHQWATEDDDFDFTGYGDGI